MYEHVLLPTDGSDAAEVAIDEALGVAELTDATVHALSVVEDASYPPVPDAAVATLDESMREVAEAALGEVRSRATERGLEYQAAVKRGAPAEQILDYADAADVDLIVMGTQGRSNLDRVLLGSVTETVVRNADVPVMAKRLDED